MNKTSRHFKWVGIVSIALCLFFLTGTLDLFAKGSSGGGSSFSGASSSRSSSPSMSSVSKSTPAAVSTPKPSSGSTTTFANAAPTPKPAVATPPSKPDTVANVPSKPTTRPVQSGGTTTFANAAPTPVTSSVSRPQVVPVKSVTEVRTVYRTVPNTYTPSVVIVSRNPSYASDFALLTYQLSVMNAMQNAAEREEMRRVMRSNAAYSSWQTEANSQAAQNAELRRELNAANSVHTGMSGGSIFLLILTGCCIVGLIVFGVRRMNK